jgi:hypothetical protein
MASAAAGSRAGSPPSPTIAVRLIDKAFVSYSHAADGTLAPALQSSLQRFARPWNQLRVMRVFVDTASLSANPRLWPATIRESEYYLHLPARLTLCSILSV